MQGEKVRPPWRKRVIRALWGDVKTGVRTLAAILLLMLVVVGLRFAQQGGMQWITNHWPHRHHSKVIVLALFANPATSSVSRPLAEGLGFSDNESRIPLGEDAEFVRIWEGPTKEDTAQHVRDALQDPNVVLVVGHERSSTVEHLNKYVYENTAVSPTLVPLILPAATFPDLLNKTGADRHILRVPSNDVAQVDLLRDAITQVAPHSTIAVIRDTSNATYSGYIGEQLTSKLSGVEQSVGVDTSLAGKGVPGDALARNTVVVVGMENLAKVLLQYARNHHAHFGTTPRLIFTDGVAGPVFESATTQLLNDNESIFMSGPFPTDRAKGARLDSFPNYKPLAATAKALAIHLLADTKAKGPITRAAVLKTMQQWMDTRQPIAVGNTTIAFDERGENLGGESHLFEIRHDGTYHALSCNCKR